jgi:hypothetical protein
MLEKMINKLKLRFADPPNKRLLSKILIDGGFITRQNLEAALARQKETNEQLGDALVGIGALNPLDLKVVLSVQGDLFSLDESVKAAAGIRIMLGEILLQAKHITSKELDAALKEKYKSGDRLGEVLVKRGLLSVDELHALLTFQQHQGSDLPVLERFRLGGILVASGKITTQQLQDVIARQKISKKKIGDLLVETGCLRRDQINSGLKLQHKLVTAAIIATISMAGISGVKEASAAGSASAKVQVTAKVMERTNMQIINQAREFVVTANDIMQGYVAVPAASRINVKSNNPRGYFLLFEVLNDPENIFSSISVDVGGREIQLSPSGGLIHQPFSRAGIATDLSYRFELSKDAQPGTYRFPLMVSLQRM